jgi:retron-type reverse transcriptase
MNAHLSYKQLITIENLFQAYYEFKKGKKKRLDLQVFERNLEDNLFVLYKSLKNKTYKHGNYEAFYVNDPKRRHIHKASVSDRVLHHLLYEYLYSLFDSSFIYDSYSCRLNKGTHKGVKRLYEFTRKVSKNYTGDCFALKCDIKKFFASVDHKILLSLLKAKIQDKDILLLLTEIIDSFSSELGNGKGIPLGNLTSQIFANIYLNELDQFVKYKLRIKHYVRYADDFVILSKDKNFLYQCIDTSQHFLENKLVLKFHPDKIIIRELSWGIDFLGYIILPFYVLPRTKTKRRIFRKLNEKFRDFKNNEISEFSFSQTVQSYLGYLEHSNSYKLAGKLKTEVFCII